MRSDEAWSWALLLAAPMVLDATPILSEALRRRRRNQAEGRGNPPCGKCLWATARRGSLLWLSARRLPLGSERGVASWPMCIVLGLGRRRRNVRWVRWRRSKCQDISGLGFYAFCTWACRCCVQGRRGPDGHRVALLRWFGMRKGRHRAAPSEAVLSTRLRGGLADLGLAHSERAAAHSGPLGLLEELCNVCEWRGVSVVPEKQQTRKGKCLFLKGEATCRVSLSCRRPRAAHEASHGFRTPKQMHTHTPLHHTHPQHTQHHTSSRVCASYPIH